MGAEHSLNEPNPATDSDPFAVPAAGSSTSIDEQTDPQIAIERKKSKEEYDHSIWLHDELSKERRLNRGISENIILEEFHRDIREFYTVENDSILGRGCTGTVRLCTRKTTGVQYALKTLRVDNITAECKQKFHKEISIMTKLDHPNILRLHEYFETDSKIYLVLDLCHGGELLDYLNSQYRHHFDEDVVRRYVRQILGGVVYLHEQGIIHRDLKLENFLLETKEAGSELKLIDFGLSVFADKHGMANDPVGTPFYVAPEVLTTPYGNKCDVWSIGVITYMMLCGRPPFFGTTDQLILAAVESQPVDYSHRRFGHVSVAAIDFVATCLDRNVKARPTAAALLDHPFFKNTTNKTQGGGSAKKPPFDVLRKLNYFLRRPVFYKLCLEAVAFSLSPEQITGLRDQFHAFDTNNTGYISIQNLHVMMAGLNLLYRAPDASLLSTGEEDHEDEHRLISYHEFIAATTSMQIVTDENIKVAFDLLAGHNNYIELDTVVSYLGSDAHGRTATDILADVDLPPEGRLSYTEFKNFLVEEYQRSMRYDGILGRYSGGDVFSHSGQTYKKHSHFMELLKNTKKKLRRTEATKRATPTSPSTSVDAPEVAHHHSSHL